MIYLIKGCDKPNKRIVKCLVSRKMLVSNESDDKDGKMHLTKGDVPGDDGANCPVWTQV